MIDLHTHTTFSDGTYSPGELVRYARYKALEAIAISDHNSVAGLNEALEEGCRSKVEIIPAVEISAVHNGLDIHMLGLLIDCQNKSLLAYLRGVLDLKHYKNREILDKLCVLGFDVSYEDYKDVMEINDGAISRGHIAKYLVKKQMAAGIEEAFDKYLGKNKAAYIKREKITPKECIGLIKQAGGVAVFAHPILCGLPENDLVALAKEFKNWGLDGIEAYYSTYGMKEQELVLNIAQMFGLLISGGSDFHGSAKKGIDLGTGKGNLNIPYEVLQRIKDYRFG